MSATMIQHASSPTGELPAMPIESASILAGNPIACGTIATQQVFCAPLSRATGAVTISRC
jgi:hypothetical protein